MELEAAVEAAVEAADKRGPANSMLSGYSSYGNTMDTEPLL